VSKRLRGKGKGPSKRHWRGLSSIKFKKKEGRKREMTNKSNWDCGERTEEEET